MKTQCIDGDNILNWKFSKGGKNLKILKISRFILYSVTNLHFVILKSLIFSTFVADAFCVNIMSKIHGKLGGVNCVLSEQTRKEIFKSDTALVLGADVSHPGHGKYLSLMPDI
jgi:hypothetical protein